MKEGVWLLREILFLAHWSVSSVQINIYVRLPFPVVLPCSIRYSFVGSKGESLTLYTVELALLGLDGDTCAYFSSTTMINTTIVSEAKLSDAHLLYWISDLIKG